eukprot:TRINITY_DN8944_c1_g1_i2.p1 TRINITY_DN8944_c1_g1~~TRINITY_DN8944_c1_g1_i2.p1  ORF type:complete len:399 (+),score=20.45 TRINITY_DN8944_c1_g1_i2:563-1759(+)
MRAPVLMRLTAFLTVAAIALALFEDKAQDPNQTMYFLERTVAVGAGCPFLTSLSSLVWQLSDVEQRIKEFRMQDSECFCCAHEHIHPETGQTIACDRQLVYKALANWWGRQSSGRSDHAKQQERLSASEMDQAVDRYNQEVQTTLLRVTRKTTNSSSVLGGYQDVVCALMPVMWAACERLMTDIFVFHRPGIGIRRALEAMATWLCVGPLSLVLAIHSASCLHKRRKVTRCGARWPRLLKVITVCVISPVWAASFAFLWFPGPILVDLHKHVPVIGDLAMLLRFLLLALITYRVFATRTSDACDRPVDLEDEEEEEEEEQDGKHLNADTQASQPVELATENDGSHRACSVSTHTYDTRQAEENMASASLSNPSQSVGCGQILKFSFQSSEARVLKMSI